MDAQKPADTKIHIDTLNGIVAYTIKCIEWNVEYAKDEDDRSYWKHELKALKRHARAVEFVNTYIPYPYNPEATLLSKENFPVLWDHLEDVVTHFDAHLKALKNCKAPLQQVFSCETYRGGVAKFLDYASRKNEEFKNDAIYENQSRDYRP